MVGENMWMRYGLREQGGDKEAIKLAMKDTSVMTGWMKRCSEGGTSNSDSESGGGLASSGVIDGRAVTSEEIRMGGG
jgi:hypothetical protein